MRERNPNRGSHVQAEGQNRQFASVVRPHGILTAKVRFPLSARMLRMAKMRTSRGRAKFI